jgi:hypothetical protein
VPIGGAWVVCSKGRRRGERSHAWVVCSGAAVGSDVAAASIGGDGFVADGRNDCVALWDKHVHHVLENGPLILTHEAAIAHAIEEHHAAPLHQALAQRELGKFPLDRERHEGSCVVPRGCKRGGLRAQQACELRHRHEQRHKRRRRRRRIQIEEGRAAVQPKLTQKGTLAGANATAHDGADRSPARVLAIGEVGAMRGL